MRPALAAFAAATVLMTAACSTPEEPAEPAATATQEETEAADDAAEQEAESGPVDVPDVSGLILGTAQGNLTLAGLETEVADEAGAPVEVEDPLAYLVVSQDPADGQLERGETVTLTVAPRG
ncbi:hypothetical protein N866_07530 [Actinotalea ferrariae CF5-4]|uniref:PASTA domain-containing protein n=1 Tax=Actinotalea ferrariae CF5-4 TaxID=948458 RepID=A0A021VTW8_9CELL|nr:hypothetical protein N866_07530 [Actinotalea ferrariae CF5-4]